jgi:hypothetical protein
MRLLPRIPQNDSASPAWLEGLPLGTVGVKLTIIQSIDVRVSQEGLSTH